MFESYATPLMLNGFLSGSAPSMPCGLEHEQCELRQALGEPHRDVSSYGRFKLERVGISSKRLNTNRVYSRKVSGLKTLIEEKVFSPRTLVQWIRIRDGLVETCVVVSD
jgi:hypothetical protein